MTNQKNATPPTACFRCINRLAAAPSMPAVAALLFLIPLFAAAQDCDLPRYRALMHQAGTALDKGQYDLAINKLQSAKTCLPDSEAVVNVRIVEVFREVNRQRELAIINAKEAKRQQKRAEKNYAEAQQARAEMEKAIVQVVESLLRDYERHVYLREYSVALEKLTTAASLKQKQRDVARGLMEIAYVQAETGKWYGSAIQIAGQAARLLDRLAATGGLQKLDTTDGAGARRAIRQALRDLDTARFDSLELRYYPAMALVPSGEATLGCNIQENPNCEMNETLHRVRIDSFRLARTEVTVWQYFLYSTAMGLQMAGTPWGLLSDHPAVYVSWYDAVSYCNWLSKQRELTPAYVIETHQPDPNNRNPDDHVKWSVSPRPHAGGYRLPAEAEWEFAARGGPRQDRFVYSGNDDAAQVGWYLNNSAVNLQGRPHRVASLEPNNLGIYDLSGNVWEWCWDWYAPYPEQMQINPTGGAGGTDRILRGGSWNNPAAGLRVANRYSMSPFEQIFTTGFRVAQSGF